MPDVFTHIDVGDVDRNDFECGLRIEALVEDGEKQFWEKQKAVTQGADMQRGAMPAANFT